MDRNSRSAASSACSASKTASCTATRLSNGITPSVAQALRLRYTTSIRSKVMRKASTMSFQASSCKHALSSTPALRSAVSSSTQSAKIAFKRLREGLVFGSKLQRRLTRKLLYLHPAIWPLYAAHVEKRSRLPTCSAPQSATRRASGHRRAAKSRDFRR